MSAKNVAVAVVVDSEPEALEDASACVGSMANTVESTRSAMASDSGQWMLTGNTHNKK